MITGFKGLRWFVHVTSVVAVILPCAGVEKMIGYLIRSLTYFDRWKITDPISHGSPWQVKFQVKGKLLNAFLHSGRQIWPPRLWDTVTLPVLTGDPLVAQEGILRKWTLREAEFQVKV